MQEINEDSVRGCRPARQYGPRQGLNTGTPRFPPSPRQYEAHEFGLGEDEQFQHPRMFENLNCKLTTRTSSTLRIPALTSYFIPQLKRMLGLSKRCVRQTLGQHINSSLNSIYVICLQNNWMIFRALTLARPMTRALAMFVRNSKKRLIFAIFPRRTFAIYQMLHRGRLKRRQGVCSHLEDSNKKPLIFAIYPRRTFAIYQPFQLAPRGVHNRQGDNKEGNHFRIVAWMTNQLQYIIAQCAHRHHKYIIHLLV